MPGEKTYSAALYYIKDVTGLLFKKRNKTMLGQFTLITIGVLVNLSVQARSGCLFVIRKCLIFLDPEKQRKTKDPAQIGPASNQPGN